VSARPETPCPDGGSPSGLDVRRLVLIVAARSVGMMVLVGAMLFVAAGTVAWPMGWAYLGVFVAGMALLAFVVVPRSPEMIAERMSAAKQREAKGWDRWFVVAIAVVLPPFMWLTAGLDHRFGWSPEPEAALAVAALVLVALGIGLVGWAMASNPFFSAVVRIQTDRGHVTVTGGPYAAVRHPGYVGSIVMHLGAPVALGSRPALGVALVIAILFVVRTALEDRTLQRELDGYAAYAARVRWRLLPWVW